MLKVAHIQKEEIQEEKPVKKSKYDDPAYFDRMIQEVIREHNAKFDRKNAKQAN